MGVVRREVGEGCQLRLCGVRKLWVRFYSDSFYRTFKLPSDGRVMFGASSVHKAAGWDDVGGRKKHSP